MSEMENNSTDKTPYEKQVKIYRETVREIQSDITQLREERDDWKARAEKFANEADNAASDWTVMRAEIVKAKAVIEAARKLFEKHYDDGSLHDLRDAVRAYDEATSGNAADK